MWSEAVTPATWISWRSALPDSLQGFTVVQQNTPLMVSLNAATDYTTELGAFQSGQWGIFVGRSVMAYLGQDGTSVTDALATELVPFQDPSLIGAFFRYNNSSQNWDSYGDVGIVIESIGTLNRFDLVFIEGNGLTSWGYDAFMP